ncbi:hypothetical protein ACT6NV_03360 [Robiginitalea sp. IMCC44478]|uniref:hypothetical protein n=1 Tax=Robiginitalea sp. IMCC44478 TaxID=3459122 RepID=UPI004042813C
MDTEELLWVYLPLLIALFETGFTIKLMLAKPLPLNSLLGFLIISLNTFSIYLLITHLGATAATYTPHIAILIATALILIQRSVVK